MNSCSACGDRFPDTEVHNCWVRAKTVSQEMLPAPYPSDFVSMFNGNLTDAEWAALHADAAPERPTE